MLAIVAPGQGAQTPGFLAPWLELPTFAARIEWFAGVCGLDLAAFGTKGDTEQIRDTAVAQPLLVAAGLAAAAELGLGPGGAAELPASEFVFAGHSVGEFTAAAAAGVLSQEHALVLVAERGRAMAAASAAAPTGMTAVLGGDRDAVLAAIAGHGLTAANDNGPGQVVAAGTLEQLAAFAAAPPEKARLVPLSVAGAFHTHHMAPAVDHLARLAVSITPGEPTAKLLSNADGTVVDSGQVFLERLVSQVSNPVRWDLCTATLLDLRVTGMIELLPGGTLTGLAKRAMRGVTGVPLRTPDDLAGARALLTRGANS
jgi:[acyl-carrier-protein] S-malonyltransferase